jgi:hypothetical protein
VVGVFGRVGGQLRKRLLHPLTYGALRSTKRF